MKTSSTTSTSSKKLGLQALARTGYTAKGILYGTVGLLTLSALYGVFADSQVTGTRGALQTIGSQPFGTILLILMAIGLVGYVVFRFAQAVTDTEGKGKDAKGLFQRAGFALSGLLYTFLSLYAIQLAGWLGGSGGDQRSEWTSYLMGQQWGVWLIGLTGLTFFGVGVYQCYRSVMRKFEKNWMGHGNAAGKTTFTLRFAQFGVAARGFTLMLIGWLIIQAALATNPEDARGLGHALRALRDESYGTVILTLIGAGMLCYGLYCFINARYRRIQS